MHHIYVFHEPGEEAAAGVDLKYFLLLCSFSELWWKPKRKIFAEGETIFLNEFSVNWIFSILKNSTMSATKVPAILFAEASSWFCCFYFYLSPYEADKVHLRKLNEPNDSHSNSCCFWQQAKSTQQKRRSFRVIIKNPKISEENERESQKTHLVIDPRKFLWLFK